ncbi:MAG: diguanylate cyclase [Lachnospiraceae bacterium]|nr:diguanylate cyclase [Lachnospiraceae bacterium]
MKREDMKSGNIAFYGATEAPVVSYLRGQLRCMEEEYKVKIFLEEAQGAEEGAERRLGIDYGSMENAKRREVDEVMKVLIPALLSYGQWQYIENQMHGSHVKAIEDPLTGTFTKEWMLNRAEVLKRAEIFPTIAVAVRIRGWEKMVKAYGAESADSLIQLTASILEKAADKDYLLGRMENNIFVVLIPLPKKGEADRYLRKIEEGCKIYEQSVFSPKLAIGIAATRTEQDDVKEKIKEAMGQVAV